MRQRRYLSSETPMTLHTMELERQLEQEKQQLRDSLSTLGSRAGDAVDWRQHVRKRPLEALGFAAAVGVAIGAMASRPGRSSGPESWS